MGNTDENLLTELLKLPTKDRACIVDQLINSLDTEIDSDVEIIWQREIQKRISEIEQGKATCISWEEVRERLRGNSVASS